MSLHTSHPLETSDQAQALIQIHSLTAQPARCNLGFFPGIRLRGNFSEPVLNPHFHISEALVIADRPGGKTGLGGGGEWAEETQAAMEQGTPRGASNISLLLKITLHKKSCSFKAQRVTEKWLSCLALLSV